MVSVIVPVYNAGKVLTRAVRSVQAQTYQTFEVIIVDDGSTDGSLRVAQRLASEDARIRVYHIDNSGGPARPRNHGIQRSKGEFVAFLDQDDWWLPHKLERQVAKFREGDYAVVYSDAVYLDPLSNERLLITDLPAHRQRFGNVEGRLPEGQVQRHLIMGNFAAQLTVVIRSRWVRNAGRMDETAVGIDCYEYLLRIALAGGSFGAVPEPLAVHERGSLSRDQETARAHTLRFFKAFSRRFPTYHEQWTFRIREYENVLITARIERIRDRFQPIKDRIAALYEVMWLHPRRRQVRRATASLLSPAIRRRLRGATRRPRTPAGP